MITQEQRKIILETISVHSPKLIGIFGSYARNEEDADSDLDILVDFENTPDLLTLIGMEQELSEKLKIKVDLVTVGSLNQRLRSSVEKDFVSLRA